LSYGTSKNSPNKKQQNQQYTRHPNCHVRKFAFYGNSTTTHTAAVLVWEPPKNIEIWDSIRMNLAPRIFVSYSHDSAEHKHWVLEFATTLRNRGIDAVLDQWDVTPGQDLAHFMETELHTCDYILMICSETYVKKANAGEGGVGYEKMIATSTLLSGIDNDKVIPIIRQSAGREVPTFLKTKLYVNFSNDSEIEYAFDELLRKLLDAPLYEKPEVGANPYAGMQGSAPDRTSDGLKLTMHVVAEAFEIKGSNSISLSSMTSVSSMHTLTLQSNLKLAVREGLLERHGTSNYSVSGEGYDYMINHGIIKA